MTKFLFEIIFKEKYVIYVGRYQCGRLANTALGPTQLSPACASLALLAPRPGPGLVTTAPRRRHARRRRASVPPERNRRAESRNVSSDKQGPDTAVRWLAGTARPTPPPHHRRACGRVADPHRAAPRFGTHRQRWPLLQAPRAAPRMESWNTMHAWWTCWVDSEACGRPMIHPRYTGEAKLWCVGRAARGGYIATWPTLRRGRSSSWAVRGDRAPTWHSPTHLWQPGSGMACMTLGRWWNNEACWKTLPAAGLALRTRAACRLMYR